MLRGKSKVEIEAGVTGSVAQPKKESAIKVLSGLLPRIFLEQTI
jgi:hypothetical protein